MLRMCLSGINSSMSFLLQTQRLKKPLGCFLFLKSTLRVAEPAGTVHHSSYRKAGWWVGHRSGVWGCISGSITDVPGYHRRISNFHCQSDGQPSCLLEGLLLPPPLKGWTRSVLCSGSLQQTSWKSVPSEHLRAVLHVELFHPIRGNGTGRKVGSLIALFTLPPWSQECLMKL